jgi:hypothetical protein
MKCVVWILSVQVIMIPLSGQVLRKPVAASYTGMGAYSFSHADAFSFVSNQASLAQVKHTTAGVYAEKKYFLNALNDLYAAAAIITSAGNFGINMRYYGSGAYRETKGSLAYARKLDEQLDIGIQFNYDAVSITGYNNASAIGAECGFIFHITKQLHTGIHARLPQPRLHMPLMITAGIGYEASPLLFIGGEITKEENQPVSVNIGLQYKLIEQVTIKAGVSAATSSVWLGAGFIWKAFRLDIVTSYHPQLGITPGLLIAFHFRNRKKNTDDTDITDEH